MKPIEFKEQTCVYAKDQPEYLPLPAYKGNDGRGAVISCWKLSFKEKVKLLFSGKLWLEILTYNKPLQPIYLSVSKKDIFAEED